MREEKIKKISLKNFKRKQPTGFGRVLLRSITAKLHRAHAAQLWLTCPILPAAAALPLLKYFYDIILESLLTKRYTKH